MKNVYCISHPVNGQRAVKFFGSKKNAMRYAAGLPTYQYDEFPLYGDLVKSM